MNLWNVCITHLHVPTWYIEIKFGMCASKTNIEPLQGLQKKVERIILVVHPRSPSEPLFTTLKFLNGKNIFEYLICRLMYRIYHGELRVFHGLFTKNSMIPIRSVIIICHCVVLTWGSVVWDMWVLLYGTTFLVLISIQTSASLFSLEVLKQQYVITYFNRSRVPHVLLINDYW